MKEPGHRPSLGASVARWSALALATPPLLGTALASLAVQGRDRSDLWLRRWVRVAQRIFGIEVEVEDRNRGQYDEPAYVFVQLNQSSLAETFVMPVSHPRAASIFVNVEYALLPWVGWHTAASGVMVVRQWRWQALRAVDRSIEALKRGHSCFICIEGRRSPDGTLQPYKKGAAQIAIRAQATIVPLVVQGSRELMPHGEWRIRPGKVRVVLLEPIPTRGMTLDDRGALTERLRQLAERELRR
jgi:1-acyl-sn-glycerol-3-phosphate acyltransferase